MLQHIFGRQQRSRSYLILAALFEGAALIPVFLADVPQTTRANLVIWIVAPAFIFMIVQAIESVLIIRYSRKYHPKTQLNYSESFSLWAFALSSDDYGDTNLRDLKHNLRTAWLICLLSIALFVIAFFLFLAR